MTHIYFVRHAEPDHSWKDDRSRPLTREGEADSHKATALLRDIPLDFAVSSPYLRSMETIRECAREHGLIIHTDERLREREGGPGGGSREMLQRRWADFSFHEPGGESLGSVQRRAVEALGDILRDHQDENILWGTHGTFLSALLHHFDASFDCDGFLQIVDLQPYIVRFDFNGTDFTGKAELLAVEKEYKGNHPYKITGQAADRRS